MNARHNRAGRPHLVRGRDQHSGPFDGRAEHRPDEQLLVADQNCRALAPDLDRAGQIGRPADPLKPQAYTVTYAIISTSNSPLNIPFFSKVTLSHANKVLTGLGYRTQLTKISTNS